LPLKAARRDAIVNLKRFFGARDTSNLMSTVSVTFTMRRHLIRLASAPLTSSGSLAKFAGFRLSCVTPSNKAERRIYGGWGENSCPILSHLWTKVHEILGRRSGPLVSSKCSYRIIRLSIYWFI